MQESKYWLKHWKQWKATLLLLKRTRVEIENDVKAISYNNELPGGNHRSTFDKYAKLMDDLQVYDDHIKIYETLVNHLENCINSLLNKEQRQVVIIYANNPDKGQSAKRELIASHNGFSTASYYRILNESLDLLDTVINIRDSDLIVKQLKKLIL